MLIGPQGPPWWIFFQFFFKNVLVYPQQTQKYVLWHSKLEKSILGSRELSIKMKIQEASFLKLSWKKSSNWMLNDQNGDQLITGQGGKYAETPVAGCKWPWWPGWPVALQPLRARFCNYLWKHNLAPSNYALAKWWGPRTAAIAQILVLNHLLCSDTIVSVSQACKLNINYAT